MILFQKKVTTVTFVTNVKVPKHGYVEFIIKSYKKDAHFTIENNTIQWIKIL